MGQEIYYLSGLLLGNDWVLGIKRVLGQWDKTQAQALGL